MDAELLGKIDREMRARRPFAVATVVAVRGSASAKPGSKALIDAQGVNVHGWVGGGCAEAYVREQALQAMEEGRPRVVTADLDDEVFGLGMPCGGVMDVYIEPHRAVETLAVTVSEAHVAAARHLVSGLGYLLEPRVDASGDATRDMRALLLALGRAIADQRGATFVPLAAGRRSSGREARALVITGRGRITEELARLGALLKWPVTVYSSRGEPGDYPETTRLVALDPGFRNFKVAPTDAVVVASQHKGDPDYLRLACDADAAYVGMVASQKRSTLILESIAGQVDVSTLSTVRAPAGLQLACRTPADIALSILCEILKE